MIVNSVKGYNSIHGQIHISFYWSCFILYVYVLQLVAPCQVVWGSYTYTGNTSAGLCI